MLPICGMEKAAWLRKWVSSVKVSVPFGTALLWANTYHPSLTNVTRDRLLGVSWSLDSPTYHQYNHNFDTQVVQKYGTRVIVLVTWLFIFISCIINGGSYYAVVKTMWLKHSGCGFEPDWHISNIFLGVVYRLHCLTFRRTETTQPRHPYTHSNHHSFIHEERLQSCLTIYRRLNSFISGRNYSFGSFYSIPHDINSVQYLKL